MASNSALERLVEAASKGPWVYEADENGPARILNVGSFPCCESWGGNLQERYTLGRANARLAVLAPDMARAGQELAKVLLEEHTKRGLPIKNGRCVLSCHYCDALDRWAKLGEEGKRHA